LRHNACDKEAIFAIAGFVAYVLACSPASIIYARFFRSASRVGSIDC
jgi:hypothetical protein